MAASQPCRRHSSRARSSVETARRRRPFGDDDHHVGTDHRVSVLGCEPIERRIGKLCRRHRPRCRARSERVWMVAIALPGGRELARHGVRHSRSPTARSPRRRAGSGSRRSSPTTASATPSSPIALSIGRTRDGPSPTSRRRRCPPTASPAASPIQSHRSGSSQCGRRGRRADRLATHERDRRRGNRGLLGLRGVRTLLTSRRSSTIAGRRRHRDPDRSVRRILERREGVECLLPHSRSECRDRRARRRARRRPRAGPPRTRSRVRPRGGSSSPELPPLSSITRSRTSQAPPIRITARAIAPRRLAIMRFACPRPPAASPRSR